MQDSLAETLATLPDVSMYRPKGIDINLLKDLREKGLSYSQVAKVAGCSKVNVLMRLNGFNCNLDDVQTYKESEGDLINGLRYRIVKHITDDEIQKAPLGTKAMVYGILYDKHRLESGQSTANHSVILNDIAAIKALDENV